MDIERTDASDIDEMVELWVALAEDQRAHGSHLLGRESVETIRRSIGQHVVGDRAFVARAGDAIVGFVTFGLEDDAYRRDVSRGFVENLYVAPSHRDDGIGAELLERAERVLADQGVDVVALEAMAANDDARRFYERAGYDLHRVELEKPLGSDTH
jgi:ribosomal protein S18 acetylase RimI-like enzyme